MAMTRIHIYDDVIADIKIIIADAHNEGWYVDKNVRQIVSEALLDHLRNPDRDIQNARHHRVRFLACEYDTSAFPRSGKNLADVVCYFVLSKDKKRSLNGGCE